MLTAGFGSLFAALSLPAWNWIIFAGTGIALKSRILKQLRTRRILLGERRLGTGTRRIAAGDTSIALKTLALTSLGIGSARHVVEKTLLGGIWHTRQKGERFQDVTRLSVPWLARKRIGSGGQLILPDRVEYVPSSTEDPFGIAPSRAGPLV